MAEDFFCTSDWHFGKRQYGLLHREKDRYVAAKYVVDTAIASPTTKFIINGGDLLDVTRPSSAAVVELQKIDKLLLEAKMPMYLVQGNHDKSDPPWFSLLSGHAEYGVQLLDEDCPRMTTPTGHSILGFPQLPRQELVDKLEKAKPADILVLHASVQEWINFPSPNAFCLQTDIPQAKFKVVVIGDTHITDSRVVSGSLCISPGSIDVGSKDEPRDKYYLRVSVDNLSEATPEPIPVRPCVTVRVESEDDMEEARKKFTEADAQEAVIYLEYNPDIPNVMDSFLTLRRHDKTYIDPTAIRPKSVAKVDDEGKEVLEESTIRTVESFAPDFTDDPLILAAATEILTTQNSMQDIVDVLAKKTLAEES